MERTLRRDPAKIDCILHHFAEARHLGKIAKLLGLEEHPMLIALGPHPKNDTLRVALAQVVYQCDLGARFKRMKEQSK